MSLLHQHFDVCGNLLQIGDKVVALTEGKEQLGSGHLKICYVAGFTPQTVRLSLDQVDLNQKLFNRKPSKIAKVYIPPEL